MTENWYLVLGLEFDPNPVTDEEVIRKKIVEKKKVWSNPSNHGLNPKYKEYSQSISKIEEDMIGAKNIRDELIRDACAKTYGPIDDALKAVQDVEISEDAIDAIAKTYKKNADIVKKRAEKLGFSIVKSKREEYQSIYDEYYTKQPDGSAKYKGQNTLLGDFHVSNLYEFLYGPEEQKKARNYSCDQLCKKAKDKDNNEFAKHDARSGSGKKLCTFCGDCFKNESSKKEYDDYLNYDERRKLLDDLKMSYEISLKVTGETYSKYLNELRELLDDKELAERILEAYCAIERIPVSTGDGISIENNPNIKMCACGTVNDTSDKRKFCKSCGLDLQIKCPKCGTLNDNNVNVCSKCGNSVENTVKALQECMQASKYIEDKNLNMARLSVAEATKLWPECDRLPGLNKDISRLDAELTGKEGLKNADLLLNTGEYQKYEFLMRELEKNSPKDANIRLADLFIHMTEAGVNRSDDLIECYKKLKKLNAKEAYYFIGCLKIYQNKVKAGKKELGRFLSELDKDNNRESWNGKPYDFLAKWRFASATLKHPKSSLSELKKAEECYRDVITVVEKINGFSKEDKETIYAESNSIKNKIKKKKNKMIVSAIVWVILATVVVAGGCFIHSVYKKWEDAQRLRAQREAEEAAIAAEQAAQAAAEEAARISIEDYTIVDDMDVDSMEYYEISSIVASSELVDTGGNVYGAVKMIDNDPSTSWQESESGGGEGSTVDITFAEVSQLSGIAFQLGSHRNEGNYAKNNRPKVLTISINGEVCDYSFEDTFCWHTIVFEKPIETDSIHIEIKEIYPGTKWNDTCIAELKVLK